MDLKELLNMIPCNADKKMRCYKGSRNLYWKFKYPDKVYRELLEDQDTCEKAQCRDMVRSRSGTDT